MKEDFSRSGDSAFFQMSSNASKLFITGIGMDVQIGLSVLFRYRAKEGKPYLHIHANACDEELRGIGGHLKKCRISGTGEIFLHTLPGKVGRQEDVKGQTGLNVFAFE